MGTTKPVLDPQLTNVKRLLAAQRQLVSSLRRPDHPVSPQEWARMRANLDYTRSLLLTVTTSSDTRKDDIKAQKDVVDDLQACLDKIYQMHHRPDGDARRTSEIGAEQEDLMSTSESQNLDTSAQAGVDSALHDFQPVKSEPNNRYTGQPVFVNRSAEESQAAQFDHHVQEKDAISTALLDLASQLKVSAQRFAQSIESEKGTLDATGLHLDQGLGSMEGTGDKMKELKRETEGAGWMQRLRLYAQVVGLWVMLVLLMVVGPKLRF